MVSFLSQFISGVTDPITQFYNKFRRYPGNNKQWWVARADLDDDEKGVKAGDFMPEILDKLFAGNNRAPRGHYILNAFYKDRANVSGIPGLNSERIDQRPTSTAFYAGRVWYGCNSNVYFSQVLSDRHKAGLCYQEADPTSENISDLIATDGGVIPIPEATKILRLVANGSGVMVFAQNGIWNVSGGGQGFSALDISVDKISPIGCKNPNTIVETEDSVFWWSDVGIMGMQQKMGQYGPIPGSFDRTNLSENTIQSLYNEIDESFKREVKGVYDARNNRIIWLYRDDDVDVRQYNRMLVFDLTLSAFYPWKISGESPDWPVLKGLFVSDRLNVEQSTDEVTVGGVQVTAGGVEVDVGYPKVTNYPTSVEYVAEFQGKSYFCQLNNPGFGDWITVNGTGLAYDSYVETGYELFNDAMRKKNITYIFSYLKKTEDGWFVNEDGEEQLNDPSSCYLEVKFDWANSMASNKWTTPVQVYRPGRFFASDDGSVDNGFPIIISKSKVRGNGKSLQFRYGTSELGRNFDLHGWSIAATGNTVP